MGGSDSTTEALPTKLHAMVFAAQQIYAPPEFEEGAPWEGRLLLGLPFIPHDGEGAYWRWHCVNLTPEGRCSDYANRPFGPCVLFEPGESRICVLHKDFGK